MRAFLCLFRPGIEYQIVPLNDVYGPTSTDPDIQALVVSRETVSGAESSELSLLPIVLKLISYRDSCNASESTEFPAAADFRDRSH